MDHVKVRRCEVCNSYSYSLKFPLYETLFAFARKRSAFQSNPNVVSCYAIAPLNHSTSQTH
ncbi:hypothetical protein [Nostoc sp. CHAB 5715]|uniref:hypothetical protein n=1 Tax=Nostoc sp. CHAB 5715 TaxID=2780400 RepID=UPI001E43EDA4|nr:hypothetical protein [Nostoc sp. CHAB 5715]MCC5622834.1 hypothetical protein [Nostoc sp. CHAB 5715]